MNHGHELKGGLLEGVGVLGGGRPRGEKRVNCNSIVYKIYIIEINK